MLGQEEWERDGIQEGGRQEDVLLSPQQTQRCAVEFITRAMGS